MSKGTIYYCERLDWINGDNGFKANYAKDSPGHRSLLETGTVVVDGKLGPIPLMCPVQISSDGIRWRVEVL